MASLREILPYLLGGAAGALGGQQAARPIQSAAAWSHKLRQDEAAKERSDRMEAMTARRLEMAEAAEERQIESHKRRITVDDLSLKEARKKAAQDDKDQLALNSARESFAENYGETMAAQGYDPALISQMTVRDMVTMQGELKKDKQRFEDIAAAQAHFQENPLGVGEGAQVYTGEGTYSTYGPRHPSTNTSKVSAGVIDADVEILNAKWDAKIEDARDEIAEAEADIANYTEEDPEYKKARRTIAQQERKIQSFDRMREAEIIKKLEASGVSKEKIDEFRNRNKPSAEATDLLQPSHRQAGTARDLYLSMIEEQQGRNPALAKF
jgi:hypothetical protein